MARRRRRKHPRIEVTGDVRLEERIPSWELQLIVATPPVRFFRPRAMRPLPRPVPGGSVADLRPFINVSDDGFALVLAWLVTTFRSRKPCPILALHGGQGTGKTTTSRGLRSLTDPSVAMVRSVPRSEDDLLIAALRSHVIAYDNLSGVPTWLSDALCRLVTGGGLSKRELYTNDDEIVIEAQRPIIINGIDDLANRPDLAERCIVLALEPIAERRDEAEFWAAFEAARPRILGALFDGVASALANVDTVSLDVAPRMLDFARWATAAESGLGLAPGRIMEAYGASMAHAVDLALDASPVATTIRELLRRPDHRGAWDGTASALLTTLGVIAGDETRRSQGWPKQPQVLTSQIKRAATFLGRVGVEAKTYRDRDGRRISLRLVETAGKEQKSVTVVTSVTARKNKPVQRDALPGEIVTGVPESVTAGEPGGEEWW